tara:strand:+ start:426 stop:752 length:327 start_codon:yes stop_codon:yes gene_type:complete
MADASMAYLEKHGVAPMLNGLVNDLAASKPDDPISFLINGLLKEATARGQEVALMARLREIKETLAKESLEVKGGGGGGAGQGRRRAGRGEREAQVPRQAPAQDARRL